ncbi:prolyl-tRNA synthetase [Sulfuricurvum kujiense DSM 16994]|uniref:Proline--tRNA ligase n=1 Tax=Sulfuricurvum kujiense (strain ATCC BAA-921 / DSM 16994 / JCM 11577 / YK-1) TaxID=709032 RepID=E4U286_SULKY|nr:proline--tRNA ligase [Sulfuricurvum kujiense]ADR33536.1 prolyl-tRNA synthetase [Sulfuricurvum kujiense DSM 16994]
MRFSKAYIPTTKEAPKDAQLPSHIYLSRAGFVTQVAAGLYNFLPMGKRVLRKIETIINEEMAACDAQEVDLSFVTPAELWEESGRIEKFGKELLRFRDRKDNLFVLGPTHEEMMVNIVRNRVTSYKQLPLNLYQIKTKFRDEARPRFGLMRGREFVMKDGYSFHSSNEDLDREFDAMEAAYKRILERLGLEFRIVEADSGAIGGTGSKELMVLAGSGEDTLAICDSCEYGANVEAARRAPRTTIPEAPQADFARFKTPNVKSIEDLSNFFHVDPYYTLKAVVQRAVYTEGSELVCFFIRGCDELQEVKARNSVGAIDLVDATEAELIEIGLVPGFIGPLDQDKIRIVMDNDTKNGVSMICGSNEADFHFVGVDLSVMNEAHFADLVSVQEGDGCPHCGGKILHTKGIEVGHIFKLGTVYSAPLKAEFLDENGRSQPFIMGTYGMGVSRLVAAVIEQHHDEKGCIWTHATAPYLVNVMVSNIKEESHMAYAEELYASLQSRGIETMLDDRKERFGFKMSDAELIGFPYTVIVGKELENGSVQIMVRATREMITVDAADVLSKIEELTR